MNESPSRVLARVDDELRALWSTPPSPGEAPKSRACTMNLVVVAASPALAEQWVPIIDAVVENVPARAIVIGLDPDGPDELDASVSAVCTPAERAAGAVVCSERVTLVARGALCRRLPSCVDALCATDVPMTLVWLARVHADDMTFTPLARKATRIVLDAARSSLASLAHAARWARELSDGAPPGVADLVWTKLGPWQELCARMFDPPRLRPLAARVRCIRFVQSSAGGAAAVGAEVALLLGWLASQLGWKTASLAGQLRLLRPDGGYVQVQMRGAEASRLPVGSILSLEVEAGDAPLSLKGEIVRGTDSQVDAATWRLQVAAGGRDEPRIEQHTRLRASAPARLLERTLHRPPRDAALAEAVAWADDLRGEELASTT